MLPLPRSMAINLNSEQSSCHWLRMYLSVLNIYINSGSDLVKATHPLIRFFFVIYSSPNRKKNNLLFIYFLLCLLLFTRGTSSIKLLHYLSFFSFTYVHLFDLIRFLLLLSFSSKHTQGSSIFPFPNLISFPLLLLRRLKTHNSSSSVPFPYIGFPCPFSSSQAIESVRTNL